MKVVDIQNSAELNASVSSTCNCGSCNCNCGGGGSPSTKCADGTYISIKEDIKRVIKE